MAKEWNHAVCTDCWVRQKMEVGNKVGDNQRVCNIPVPVRAAHKDSWLVDLCCFCARATAAGIYIRHDPDDPVLSCHRLQGVHKDKGHYHFFEAMTTMN